MILLRKPSDARIGRFLDDPRSGLAGRAGEALILLTAVLTVSVSGLVPGQGAGLLGAEILVVGSPPGGGSWLSSCRGCGSGRP